MTSRVAAVFVLCSSFLSDSSRSDKGLDLCRACEDVTDNGFYSWGTNYIGALEDLSFLCSSQAATGFSGDNFFRSDCDSPRKKILRFSPEIMVPQQKQQSENSNISCELRNREITERAWCVP